MIVYKNWIFQNSSLVL